MSTDDEVGRASPTKSEARDDPRTGHRALAPKGLSAAQCQLLVETTVWRKRNAERLARRFARWLRADEIEDLILDTVTGCAMRFDEAIGVPFEAYALKAIVYAVSGAARRRRARALRAYRAAVTCGEAWLVEPTIVFADESDQRKALDGLAQQGATAMGLVLSGVFSSSQASDAEGSVLDAFERKRVMAAVDAMSDRKREVLRRRYGLDGEKVAELVEIAKSLGVGVITVRRAHTDALAELRERLAGLDPELPASGRP